MTGDDWRWLADDEEQLTVTDDEWRRLEMTGYDWGRLAMTGDNRHRGGLGVAGDGWGGLPDSRLHVSSRVLHGQCSRNQM
jgi:hypothetical protein